MDFLLPFLSYLSAVGIGSGLTLYLRWHIVKFNQKAQENHHLITCCQKFCDDLLEYTGDYWHMDSTDPEAEKLSIKISISTLLIMDFIKNSFAQDNNINNSLKEMTNEVTSGDFGVRKNLPKPQRITLSIRSIIKLRCALSKAKLKDET